jgi:hypothetical protein
MAHLIIVHRDHNDQEIVLNADNVVSAERVGIGGAKSYTMVTLANGKSLTIRETLNELCRLPETSSETLQQSPFKRPTSPDISVQRILPAEN